MVFSHDHYEAGGFWTPLLEHPLFFNQLSGNCRPIRALPVLVLNSVHKPGVYYYDVGMQWH
jgi:hypothetical protein